MTETDPVWGAIRSRRVVLEFADRRLEPDHLERILRAGRRANSSKNLQRWAFIVCRDGDHLAELAQVGSFAGHLAGAAAAIALVTPDPRAEGVPLSVMFDLGQAADSMMLTVMETRKQLRDVAITDVEKPWTPPQSHCSAFCARGMCAVLSASEAAT